MTDGDDPRLRAEFDALRSVESERAPEFAQTLAAARKRAPSRRRAVWRPLLGAAAAAALVLWMLPRTPRDEPKTSPALGSLGSWSMPTDVLLETPGRGLLRDLPDWDLPDPIDSTDGGGASTSRFERRMHA